MKIDLLCSGSKGNSCLVRSDTTSILIDCGPTTKRYQVNALQECGVSIDNLDALLITHTHSDHIRQLKHFQKVPVYTCNNLVPKDTKGNPIEMDLHMVRWFEPFEVGDFSILPLPLSHDSGPTMGFVISCQEEKLVYITDTGYISQSVLEKIKNADHYIMESNHNIEMLMHTDRPMSLKQRITSDLGHLCNEDASLILARSIGSRTKNIVLAHLSEEANTPALALNCLYETFDAHHLDWKGIHIEAALQFERLHIENN